MLLRPLAFLIVLSSDPPSPAALPADDAKQPIYTAEQNAPAQSGAAAGSPTAKAESTAKGQLKSPYSDFAKVADEGHQKFMAAGCNGCHGGGGGGGRGAAPPQ